MKKLILFALASLSIISCRKDDDQKQQPTIVGTWKLIDYRSFSGKDGSIIFSNTIPENDCRRKSNHTYKIDGKYVGEYFFNPNTGICGNDIFTEEMNYIYNEAEQTITYKIDNLNQDIVKISLLTEKEMHLLVNEDIDQNSDGIMDKTLSIFVKR